MASVELSCLVLLSFADVLVLQLLTSVTCKYLCYCNVNTNQTGWSSMTNYQLVCLHPKSCPWPNVKMHDLQKFPQVLFLLYLVSLWSLTFWPRNLISSSLSQAVNLVKCPQVVCKSMCLQTCRIWWDTRTHWQHEHKKTLADNCQRRHKNETNTHYNLHVTEKISTNHWRSER